MAAWGYEFYLLVLKISLSALEDKIRIPKRPTNILYLWFPQTFCKNITPEYRQNKIASLLLFLVFAGIEGKDLKKRLLIYQF